LRGKRLITFDQSVQSHEKVALGVAIFLGRLWNSFDKYSTISAPFSDKLMSNTIGWVASRTDDGLANRFLYPANQGLLPD
jgi:hypothetical protein